MTGMEILTYKTVKIAWHTAAELSSKLNLLLARRILCIRPCTPDWTDTKHWADVHYEYYMQK